MLKNDTIGTNFGIDHTKNDSNKYDKELTEKEKMVVLALIENPYLTYSKLAEMTGLSKRTISRITKQLVEKKYLERVGNNKKGSWKVI